MHCDQLEYAQRYIKANKQPRLLVFLVILLHISWCQQVSRNVTEAKCANSSQLGFGVVQAGKAGQANGDTHELWLYLEEAKNDKPLVPIAADNVLLFFKLYDPKRQTLSYLGRCYAWETNRLPALMSFLRRKAGYTDNVALQVSAQAHGR